MENIKCKLTPIKLFISKPEFTYNDEIWIDDEFHPSGGFEIDIKRYYKDPIQKIDIYLKSNVKLVIGGDYTDGEYRYLATSEYELTLLNGNILRLESNSFNFDFLKERELSLIATSFINKK